MKDIILWEFHKNKFIVVSNYVNPDTFKIDTFDETIINKYKNYKSLIYVGGFDIHRGLESVIRAVPLILKSIPEFKLVLVGAGANLDSLKMLSKKLEVEKYVSFEGWQPHTLLPSYINAADVCLIPHLKTQHTDNTIPHKLFQYMLLKKPIIASNCNPIERILNEVNAGLIYEANNENDLAEKAILLLSDVSKQKQFSENGYKAVKEKYNWKSTSKKLIELYERIRN